MALKKFCISLVMTFMTMVYLLFSVETYAKDQYLLKIKNVPSFFNVVAKIESLLQLTVLDRHDTGKLILIDLDENKDLDRAERLQALSQMEELEYFVPNIKIQAFFEPNDPKLNEQWALEKVKATAAWEIQQGSPKIVVAVIDTGVDWQHEDLKDRIWKNSGEIPGNGIDDDSNGYIDDVRGWDFNGQDNNPQDETSSKNPGHGTHCAGIIGATGNNNVGISGIAPFITIMPVRFISADGSGDLMGAVKSIDYAIQNGAQVISASWGAAVAKSGAQPILEAVERASLKKVVFVAAAANDGKSNDTREVYPANAPYNNVISVAASNPSDAKPQWSNFGKATVHVAAPGENIFSTIPGNRYQKLSGTSMATPLVAGLVGLLKSQALAQNQEISPLAIKSILQKTGADSQIETACQCRVDALSALKSLSENALTVTPAALTLDLQGTAQFSAIGGKGPYQFSLSNAQVASISESGLFKAQAKGETTVRVTDSLGSVALSKTIFIGQGGGGGGGGGQCPFDNPALCEILCQTNPQFPWCFRSEIAPLF